MLIMPKDTFAFYFKENKTTWIGYEWPTWIIKKAEYRLIK